MPISSGGFNERRYPTGVTSKSNSDENNGKPNKKFLTISPALPCLPAIPKRHKLQYRSNSTLSVGEADMPPCSSVSLQATADGTIQAHRSQKEREKNPDRLHLDRRGLTTIPQLVEESQLRFLSLQHNLLTKLDNLSKLRLSHLVFLDLYDNQLEKISGIGELENLRVLLIGKNRIRHIEGLQTLLKLEVLDLHGNQVAEVDGLITLRELKVLNLAGNLIRALRCYDLKGLRSLQELNLRKNKIRNLLCFGETCQLTKLYLSNNDIQSLEDLSNVAMAVSLKEISIDGNPVSLSSECVSFLVSHLPNLQLLSNMQVTDHMRKMAAAWRVSKYGPIDQETSVSRKEDAVEHDVKANGELTKIAVDLRSEQTLDHSRNSLTPEESLQVKLPPLLSSIMPIENLSEVTISESESDNVEASSSKTSILCSMPQPKAFTAKNKQKPSSKFREQGGDYLIEINGRILSVYGQGALRFIDRPWNPVKAGDVTTVKFTFVNFNNLSSVLCKIKFRFPNAEHFHFLETNIYCLGQLNALADVQGLTSLVIDAQGNPITEKEWRSYAVYRLSHWGLKSINEVQLTDNELASSESEFQGLTELVISCLPDTLLEPLLERLHLGQSITQPREWLESAEPAIRSVVAKEALQWKKSRQEDASLKHKGKLYMQSIIHSAVSAIVKLRRLKEEWPGILNEIVRDTLSDYSHLDSYMKNCMSDIKL